MEEKITLCGDNCIECPRYNAHSEEELHNVGSYGIEWAGEIISCPMKKSNVKAVLLINSVHIIW